MGFEFVIETPKNRGINRNNNRLIQKRATQAGARTRLGKKSKHKVPDSDTPTLALISAKLEIPATASVLANAGLASEHNSPFLTRFGNYGQLFCAPDAMSTSGHTCFEIRDPNFSILQKRLLKTVSIHTVAGDANRLFKIMSLTQKQFLTHLPAHYGRLSFLDESIECLIARLHETIPLVKLGPNGQSIGQKSPAILYAKALQSLRAAIDNDLASNLSYIWFAIMLLTLFELLSCDDEPGWVWHAAGAARILYKVGPENIKSEFHMSLLASQCRIMVIETIFTNKPCYLADPRWQQAIRRTALDSDDFADRSAASTELWAIGARIPNVFQAVCEYIHGFVAPEREHQKTLVRRIIQDLVVWKQDWMELLKNNCRDVLKGDRLRHQSLMILMSYYMLTAITYRLQVATQPYESGFLENEVQLVCASLFDLRRSLMSCEWSARNSGSVYTKVARATLETALRWKKEIELATPGISVDEQTFDEWCAMIGRTAKVAPLHPLLNKVEVS